ncbi:BSD domain-containing protein [Escovopsis weberi]|uniref:BSD domain-containing protein n=1 Tax=Escovopsis weberi TaxID=150374 RepID=A0A0M8N099_ESCWE|nr:BSD domain-containing protein [Escovopsis weberi]
MDFAYDHIHEQTFLKDSGEETGEGSKKTEPSPTLTEDVQEAYKAFAASPWGSRIGGFLGSVVKQGESVYNQASKELAEVSEDATKGFSGLRDTIINRTRSLSLTTIIPDSAKTDASNEGDENQTTPTRSKGPSPSSEDDQQQQQQQQTESATVLSRLRSEATKRLKDLQKAEDAADEALLRFGSNVRDFLRDAITIAPPSESAQENTVLFESKDAEGKRVIHASRFDAQLHVIHTSTDGFSKNPESKEYDEFARAFDVEKKTDEIATDLGKYPELRSTMEKLVPDQIPYANFWKRYYFLRHTASNQDEVGWSDDSDSEEDGTSKAAGKRPVSVESSTTIHPPTEGRLQPGKPRKSNDGLSQADSEASYDVVGATSGFTTQATSSPKEEKKEPKMEAENTGKAGTGEDDSDEDWE